MWAGVVTAVYVIVSSLTGSLIMLKPAVEAWTSPPARADLAGGQRTIDAETAIAALGGAMEEFRPASLVMPEEPGSAYGGYLISRGRFAYAEIHPVTGAVTRLVTRDNSWWRFVEDLHNNLLTGRTGRVVNGIGGLALALLCVTGLFIWWPGRAAWRRGLMVDPRARWPRLLWDLHGATGMWLLPLVFVIALTGVYFTWPQVFRAGVERVLPVAPRETPLRFAEAAGQPRASIASFVAAAEAAVPGSRVAALQLPEQPTQALRATLLRPGEQQSALSDTVLLHPATGRVVRVDRQVDRLAGDRLLRWISALHTGHFAGIWSASVWFVVGLAMAVLAASGLVVWCNRVIRPVVRRSAQNVPRRSTAA
jgi:uncharacterized iron-regulated membrane protein